jgi:hypothetical protein
MPFRTCSLRPQPLDQTSPRTLDAARPLKCSLGSAAVVRLWLPEAALSLLAALSPTQHKLIYKLS